MSHGNGMERVQVGDAAFRDNRAINVAAQEANAQQFSGAPWSQAGKEAMIANNMRGVVNTQTGEVNTNYNGALTGSGPGSLYHNPDLVPPSTESPANGPANSPDYSLTDRMHVDMKNPVNELWQEHPDIAYQMMAGFSGGADASAAQKALDNWSHPSVNNEHFNTVDAAGDGSSPGDNSGQDNTQPPAQQPQQPTDGSGG